jgi:hypothetical protein
MLIGGLFGSFGYIIVFFYSSSSIFENNEIRFVGLFLVLLGGLLGGLSVKHLKVEDENVKTHPEPTQTPDFTSLL